MSEKSFDTFDQESWFLENIGMKEAHEILKEEPIGSFLVRNSSRGNGFILCVREQVKVVQYQITITKSKFTGLEEFSIREEFPFPDLPALLSFYKRNQLETTSLIRPASIFKSKVVPDRFVRVKSMPIKRSSIMLGDDFLKNIKVGDVIKVISTHPNGNCWVGEHKGEVGFFSAMHAEPLENNENDKKNINKETN